MLRARIETGAAAVEYALLIALISVVIIVAVAFLGRAASSKFCQVGTAISGGTTCQTSGGGGH